MSPIFVAKPVEKYLFNIKEDDSSPFIDDDYLLFARELQGLKLPLLQLIHGRLFPSRYANAAEIIVTVDIASLSYKPLMETYHRLCQEVPFASLKDALRVAVKLTVDNSAKLSELLSANALTVLGNYSASAL